MRLSLALFGAVFAHTVHARIGFEETNKIQTHSYFGEDKAYWSRNLDDSSMSFPTAAPTTEAPTTTAPTTAAEPDFGPNVRIFDPSMSTSEIQVAFDSIWELQRNNEMGTERYGLYFLPGMYGTDDEPLQIKIGYYTEVAGLGSNPDDVQINGKIEVYNRCFEADPYQQGMFIPTDDTETGLCFALNNFWRSLSNLAVNINSKGQEECRASANFWAVSQASSMRRVDFKGGDVTLMDSCSNPAYSSGGFIADSRAGVITNGSQQQWISRNMEIAEWSNASWNQFFAGVLGAPDDTAYPNPPYTTIEKTPVIREKPFLFVDANGKYQVHVPSVQAQTSGISWANGKLTQGTTISISDFFIAKPSDSVEAIKKQLAKGKHLVFTPGVYDIGETIQVPNANTVILGMGQATLTAVDGAVPLKIADKPGIIVAGMTIDAGSVESPVLLQIGEPNSSAKADPENPTTLHDVYFRIGGPHIGKTNIALEINANNVVVDHTWVCE
jgi:hypothetical protein